MAKLIYAANVSLDGYIEDVDGRFDWTEPDEEVHTFFNDLVRPHGTFLYGRRMYETMRVWEADDPSLTGKPYTQEFAEIWRAADKIVYSRTLDEVATARTRIERDFDPEAVQRLKDRASRDIGIGGPGLAAHAFRAGLVDECHLVLVPVSVGGGKRALPEDVRLEFELLDEGRFRNGTVHLHYRVRA